jgi:hypothetical protein
MIDDKLSEILEETGPSLLQSKNFKGSQIKVGVFEEKEVGLIVDH